MAETFERDGSTPGRLAALIEALTHMANARSQDCLVVFTYGGGGRNIRRVPLFIAERINIPSLLEALHHREGLRPDVTVEELERAIEADDHRPILPEDHEDQDGSVAFSGDTASDHTHRQFRAVRGLSVWDGGPDYIATAKAVAQHILSITDGELPTVRPFGVHFIPEPHLEHHPRFERVCVEDVFDMDEHRKRDHYRHCYLDDIGHVAMLHLHYLDPAHPLLLAEDARWANDPERTWDDVTNEDVDEVFDAVRAVSRSQTLDRAARAIQRFWRDVGRPRIRAARVIQSVVRERLLYTPCSGAMYVKASQRWRATVGA